MKRLWPFGWFHDKEDTPKKLKIEKKPLPVRKHRVLSYGNWMEILAVMDPSDRLDIFQSIPSSRIAEKLLPLKIDVLSFSAMGMTINNTTRQFGIMREFYPGHKTTYYIRKDHKRGGARYDMDQFGLEERAEQGVHVEFYDEEFETLPTREENMRSVVDLEDSLRKYVDDDDGDDDGDLPTMEQHRRHSIFPLRLQRDNRPGPYDSFLQFKKSSKGSKEAVVFKKIYQPGSKAMFPEFKKMVYDFLDGRNQTIEVRRLEFSEMHATIPLPPNVKFKIKELSFRGDLEIALDQVLPFIDESSFPLDVVETTGKMEDDVEVFGHPVVRNAKLLVLNDPDGWMNPNYRFDLFPKNVHYVDMEGNRERDLMEYPRLIRYWLEHPPEVGTRFTAGFYTEKFYLERLEEIKQEFNLTGERSFTIPLPDDTQIKIDFKTMDPEDPRNYNQSFMLILEVLPVQPSLEVVPVEPLLEVVPVQRVQQQGFFSGLSKISSFFWSIFGSRK